MDHPVERRSGELADLAARLVAADGLEGVAYAGAVDQDAFLAVRRACSREAGIDLVVRADIDLAEDSADLGGDRLALLGVHVEQCDPGARRRERAGSCGAEARGAAGDHRRHVLKVHHILLSRSFPRP